MPEFDRLLRQTARMHHLKRRLPRPLWPIVDLIWKWQISAYLNRFPSDEPG